MIDIIKRPHYLNAIRPFIGKELIKVIVGQRRVGKSYFLKQIMGEIASLHSSANIISINKELYEFDAIRDYHDLVQYVRTQQKPEVQNALFIDEIQDIAEFERALRSLQAESGFDIYISGSNAELMSGELATYLSGRYLEVTVYSLSFPEFLTFYNFQATTETLYKYIKFGGLPYLLHLEFDESVVYNYLQGIYSSIILKDVVTRHQIRHVDFLDNLIKYLAHDTGRLISAKKISDYLKSQHLDVSPSVILNYLSFLSAAFFTHRLKRQNIAGKKIFEIGEKIYFQDIGIKHAVVPFRQDKIGQVLENLVNNHLLFCGYKVYTGQLGVREIDFVAERDHEKLYVQVVYILSDDQVVRREFGNLLLIKDNYRKIVVSFDEWSGGSYEGVEHLTIIEFLTKFK